MDVSVFLDEGQELESGILNCGKVFVRLELSQVVVIRAKTSRRRDVTVSVGGDFLNL